MKEEMDENNLQTSVVIEVANREEQKDNNNLYKIDYNEVGSTKDYVIDQIFCGENLTIYALFEISDVTGRNSEKHLIEVTDSPNNDEFRFYHRSSFKKAIEEKEFNGFEQTYPTFNSEEIERLTSKDITHMKESFYCLKNYNGKYDVTRTEDSTDLKVLYTKKNQTLGKFKFVSRGVNTDIAQCPKLVDDVRKAIKIGTPFGKDDGKTIEITAFPPVKSSYEIIEMEAAPSSSSFGSDMEDFKKYHKKSCPNVLLVPLLMMNEGVFSTFQADPTKASRKEENCSTPEKISLGINTDFSCSELLDLTAKKSEKTQELEEPKPNQSSEPAREEIPEQLSKQTETESKETEEESSEKKEENQEPEREPGLATKKNILKEMKNLQNKLNSLIQSLECNECRDLKSRKDSIEKASSLLPLEELSRQSSSQQIDSTARAIATKRNQRKFDDIPIFSPVGFVNTVPVRQKNSKIRKKPSNPDRDVQKEPSPIQSNSAVSILTTSVSGIFKTQPIIDSEFETKDSTDGGNEKGPEEQEPVLQQKPSESTNVISNNKISISKSECFLQARIFIPDSKYSFALGLRKAFSYESKEDKSDSLGSKKVKSVSLKFDGSFKTKNNVRPHSNVENVLPNNLTPLNCEMGDEIGKKQKQDILTVEQKINEEEGLLKVLEQDVLQAELKKAIQSEEDGDAKISFQSPPYSPDALPYGGKTVKVFVNYCTPCGDKTLKSEGPLKKNADKPGLKSGINAEIERKDSSPIEKSPTPTSTPSTPTPSTPTTPIRSERKSIPESNTKKEPKIYYKSKIPDKTIKTVKKEIIPEQVKYRTLTWNRPKSNAQSKLHVDKLIKKVPGNAAETSNKFQGRYERDEKIMGKTDHILHRSTGHKRERREVLQPSTGIKEREFIENRVHYGDLINTNRSYSQPSSQNKGLDYNSQKNCFEEKLVVDGKPQIPIPPADSSSIEDCDANLPSVVVELFSKKPNSAYDSHNEFDQDVTTGPDTDTTNSHLGFDEKNFTDTDDTDMTLESNVKSVWALTKVLLYGDGSKKFEVLEVSLTPPECPLNYQNPSDLKNR